MTSGGHARSGPPKREGSARADAAGYSLTALPAEGYQGEVPEWPIEPQMTATEGRYWERAWRTPQACIWSKHEFAWMVPDVARWVRLTVRCDEPDAPATLLARLPSSADAIGMTAAGLARFGAKIAPDEVGKKRFDKAAVEPEPKQERRLRKAD